MRAILIVIAAARARGLAVQVWTINDPADMAALMDLGVDAIMTDRVDVMRRVRGRGRGVGLPGSAI